MGAKLCARLSNSITAREGEETFKSTLIKRSVKVYFKQYKRYLSFNCTLSVALNQVSKGAGLLLRLGTRPHLRPLPRRALRRLQRAEARGRRRGGRGEERGAGRRRHVRADHALQRAAQEQQNQPQCRSRRHQSTSTNPIGHTVNIKTYLRDALTTLCPTFDRYPEGPSKRRRSRGLPPTRRRTWTPSSPWWTNSPRVTASIPPPRVTLLR